MFIRARIVSSRAEVDLPEGHPWLRDGRAVHVKPKLYPPSREPRRAKYPPKNLRHPTTPAVEETTNQEGEI